RDPARHPGARLRLLAVVLRRAALRAAARRPDAGPARFLRRAHLRARRRRGQVPHPVERRPHRDPGLRPGRHTGAGRTDAVRPAPVSLVPGRPQLGRHGDQMTVPTSSATRVSMACSATAAMVIDGLQAAVLPGMSAPSSTYRPRWPSTRPLTSQTVPMQAPPRACQVDGNTALVASRVVSGPALRWAGGPALVS